MGYAAASVPRLNETPVYWVFSGDTERNPAFWQRVNELNVGLLVIENTFSNDARELAQCSLHLCAEVLLQELQLIQSKKPYPIYLTHAKPSEMTAIMQEIEPYQHQLACLAAGQEFEV